MKLTRNNLNEVLFENHDARLLIEDVVSHTQAGIYYYHDVEITLQAALKIWNRANEAEQNETPYHASFLEFERECRPQAAWCPALYKPHILARKIFCAKCTFYVQFSDTFSKISS